MSAIDKITLPVLQKLSAQSGLNDWVFPLQKTCTKFGIIQASVVVCFLATIDVECDFKNQQESLYYKDPAGLRRTYPKYFKTDALATLYLRNSEKVANYVYANRMGNGPPESGDGFRFRGSGPNQLTGKDNHTAFANDMGMTLAQEQAYIQTIEGGCMSAGWFWSVNGIVALAVKGGIDAVSMKVNTGSVGPKQLAKVVGLKERRAAYAKVLPLIS